VRGLFQYAAQRLLLNCGGEFAAAQLSAVKSFTKLPKTLLSASSALLEFSSC